MAKHIIRVEYLEKSGVVNSVSFDEKAINVSNFNENTLGNVNAYNNEFLLNYSDLSGKSRFFPNSVGYYISEQRSDSEGNIDVTLTVNTTKAKSLSLVFSQDVFPVSITINGISYENTDNVFQVVLQENSSEVTTIQFTKLNKSNSPLILTNISPGISIDYDEKHIISFIRGSELSTNNETPRYELVGQYGSCSFIDAENVVVNLKIQGILEKPKNVQILLDGEVVGKYTVSSWSYNTTNSIVEIEFSDSIETLRNVDESGYFEYFNDYNSYSYLDLFNLIKEKIISYEENFEELSSEVESWLSSIKTMYIKYEPMKLDELIVHFCVATQTTIYKNQKGNLEVYLWR